MKEYRIVPDEAWVDGVFCVKGDKVRMSERKATYLVMAGTIAEEPAEAPAEVVPAAAPSKRRSRAKS